MPTNRLTTRRLMILVAIAAWFSWLIASILRRNGFAVVLAYFSVLAVIAVVPWSVIRGSRSLAGRSFAASSAIGCVILAVMGVFTLHSMMIVFKMIVGLVMLPISAACGVAWARASTAPGVDRRVPRVVAWSLVVLMLVLPGSMIFSRWPMRAAFLASRPALQGLAKRVAAGETLESPEWAGFFQVQKAHRTIGPTPFVGLVVEHHVWLILTDSPEVDPKVPSPAYETESLGDDGRWWFSEYF